MSEATSSPRLSPLAKCWRALLLAVCLLGLLGLFFIPISFSRDAFFWYPLLDSAHLPAFLIVAAGVHRIFLLLLRSSEFGLWTSAVLTILAVFAIEAAQPFFGRATDLLDLVWGLFGCLSYFVLYLCFARDLPKKQRMLYVIVVCFGISLVFFKPLALGFSLRHRALQFPVLGAFESSVELNYWHGQHGGIGEPTVLQIEKGSSGSRSGILRVQTGKGSWAGVTYSAGLQDWSHYDYLVFDIKGTTESFHCAILLQDLQYKVLGGRSYFGFQVEAEKWTTIRIGTKELVHQLKSRPLSLANIVRLAFFTGQDENGRIFYLDNVRLEKGKADNSSTESARETI